MFTYNDLLGYMKRALRNGSWFKLPRLERALYRASLILAKMKGKILNADLITQLLEIIEKLLTPKMRIMKLGFQKAKELITAYKKGYLSWCPELLEWLTDKNYIFWLGLKTQALNCFSAATQQKNI
jgi:hypothetical protein